MLQNFNSFTNSRNLKNLKFGCCKKKIQDSVKVLVNFFVIKFLFANYFLVKLRDLD